MSFRLTQEIKALLSEAQLINHHPITIDLVLFEVVQKPSPLSHQFEQASPGVMIPFVGLEMFGQISDPLAEQGDLNLWRSRVLLVAFKLLDDVFLFLLNQCHEMPPSS